jgi:hypothetical protein
MFENEREKLGTYVTEPVGDRLKGGLGKHWPSAPLEVVPVEREGHQMFDLFTKTDPLTVSEMRAFVHGFFTNKP